MTPESIQSRNAANAQQSTGPKSAEGKAISSQNACRHGATGQLPREQVSQWLAIILDQPDIEVTSFVPISEVDHAALQLASAEARLAQCQNAFADFLEHFATEDAETLDINALYNLITHELESNGLSRDILSLVVRFTDHLEDIKPNVALIKRTQHRLMKRYLREAQTGRSRALRRWIEVSRAEMLPA